MHLDEGHPVRAGHASSFARAVIKPTPQPLLGHAASSVVYSQSYLFFYRFPRFLYCMFNSFILLGAIRESCVHNDLPQICFAKLLKVSY